MKFWEAMKALEEGKKVRCKCFCKDIWFDHISIALVCLADFTIGALRDNEWELYEEPVQLLSFAEVVSGLKEGRKFKRKEWIGLHIQNFPRDMINNGGVAFIANKSIANHISFQPEDFKATDWIECD